MLGQEKLLAEVLKEYPELTSRAFSLNQDNSNFYFLITEPKMMSSQKISSHARVLKINTTHGYFIETSIAIKVADKVNELTFKEFEVKVYETIGALKVNENIEATLKLRMVNLVKECGFFYDFKPL